MNDTERYREIFSWCLENQDSMLDFLEQIVLTNSYTWNKQGADAVGKMLQQELESIGMEVKTVEHQKVGNTLLAKNATACKTQDIQGVLLCGHLDTVFPLSLEFSCFERKGETLRGPGVIDMKGGLVSAIWALRALREHELLNFMPITMVINADEEVGSPYSTSIIQDAARSSAFAYVFECSGLEGQVVTSRKGKHGFTVTCTGRAGHVGQAGADKPSAILELAHKVIALEAMNAPQRNLSCNVGKIQGGTSPNSIPEKAIAEVDFRFEHGEDHSRIVQAMEDLAAQQHLVNVTTHVQTVNQRSPMLANEHTMTLYGILRECAEMLDMSLPHEQRGGVSDANTISNMNIPVLDGLGPSGDRDHSTDEYMMVQSLPQRAALAAAGMLKTWRHLVNT